MNDSKPSQNPLVVSHLTLRRCVGLIGLFLPFVLALGLPLVCREVGCQEIQSSISRYYHTAMGDVFVGALCAVGVFLLVYKGYDNTDNAATNITGFGAIGTALFPVALPGAVGSQKFAGNAHVFAAAVFFLGLAYIALRLFPKPDPSSPALSGKNRRNRLYRTSGLVIVIAMALIACYGALNAEAKAQLEPWTPVYWLEAIAILAFGVAWLVKGRTLQGISHMMATRLGATGSR